MAIRASKLDVAEAVVAENMAANAYLCLVLSFNAGSQHFEVFFEFRFSSQ